MSALGYAFRQLRRSPAFALAAIVSLALGIGANTAMFTLADALLFRPIPVSEPARLIRIAADTGPNGQPGAIPAPVADLIEQDHVFDGVCGFLSPLFTVQVNGRIAQMAGHAMTGNCFATLGVRTMIGRSLTAGDDRPDAAKVVVVSYDTWLREFSGSPAVLGQTMAIEGGTFTIVGVAERAFTGLMVGFPERLFIPFSHLDLGVDTPPRALLSLEAFARLPSGMSAVAAQARLQTSWPHWLQASVPAPFAGAQRDRYLQRRLIVTNASTGVDYALRPRFQTPLVALLAISGLVLLITCVNVANLLLARAAERHRETLVRSALGASRWALLRDAGVESALLVGAGAMAGVLMSYWIDKGLVALFSVTSPTFSIEVAPNVRVLAFTCAVSALAFIVFAIAPAWSSSNVDAAALNAASTRMTGGHRRLRRMAIAVQVGLTIVLVTAGSLFLDVLTQLQAAPLGLSAEPILSAQLVPLPGGYQDGFAGDSYYRHLLAQVTALPGVGAAAFSRSAPLAPSLAFVRASVAGSDVDASIEQMFVSDDFFSTLQIPLIAGATFRKADRSSDARRTAIVSESASRSLFGSSPAIGRTIRVGTNPQNRSLGIIGVARDAVLSSPQRRNTSIVYLNFWQFGNTIQGWSDLIVRTNGDPRTAAEAIPRVVRNAGHEYVSHLRTLADLRDMALAQERLLALMSTAFGVLGLTLAAVGLYGLLSFSVAQRVQEIGVRMALGANRRQILTLVLRDAGTLVATGILGGAPAAWAANRTAASLIYGRGSIGAAPIAVAVTLMIVVAAVAVWRPARRAASIDPMQALRRE